MLPFVVCRFWEIQARYCVGVHISMVELTSLVIQPFQLVSILINPNVVLAWVDFDMYLAMCEPPSVPLLLVGIIPNLGVAVLMRY